MIRVVAAILAAVATTGGTVEIRDVVSERHPSMDLVIRVLDDAGRQVAGLGTEAFSVFEDGQRVEQFTVRPSHPDEDPLAVSLLIDTSGSMRGAALDGAKTGASAFLTVLTPEDLVEIVGFGSTITPILRFGEPIDPTRIDSLVAEGDTLMRDALSQEIDTMLAQPTSNRAIVLLTDGVDDGSATSDPDIAASEG